MAGFTLKAARAANRSATATQTAAEAAEKAAVAGQVAAEASRAEAAAAQAAAEASKAEAEATLALVEETRRDRELAWQPVIDARRDTGIVGRIPPNLDPPVLVRNVGGGPAIGLRVFWWPDHNETKWFRSVGKNIGAGQERPFTREEFVELPALPRYGWFGYGENPGDRNHQGYMVFFWRDVLGWRYRLPVIPMPVAKAIGVYEEGVFDLRTAEPERRRPGNPVEWEGSIQIFPTSN